jgi:hypothetical protein
MMQSQGTSLTNRAFARKALSASAALVLEQFQEMAEQLLVSRWLGVQLL